MKINEEKRLKELLKDAVIEGLLLISVKANADSFSQQTPYLPKKYQFPELKEFASGLPRFSFHESETIDYAEIYKKNSENELLIHANQYREFLLECDFLQQYFSFGKYIEEPFLNYPQFHETMKDIFSYGFIGEFCDTYVYTFGMDFSDNDFDYLFNLYFSGISSTKLDIIICVPILLVKFESDKIILDSNVSIERMSNGLQLARNEQMSLTGTVNKSVIGAATHALMIRGWSVPNRNKSERGKVLFELSAYKKIQGLVDIAFSALRVAMPNLETGYGQIIALEDGWRTVFHANLPEVVVLSERNYPQHFENFGWLNETLPVRSDHDDDIRNSFIHLSNSPQLQLVVNRLNKASLSNRDDDSIIDIAIALESILTSDSKSEINYRLSTRAALLCKKFPFKKYSAKEIVALCKRIYDFRSSIVHGEFAKQQKKRLITVEQNKIIVINELALEFLKHIIWALSLQPEIQKAADIDDLLFS